MLSKKQLFTLITIFGLNGCLSSNYYVLSTATQPVVTYMQTPISIGVEKVIVPEYLFKREIAVAKSSSQVSFVNDGTWAEDMNAGLTTRLIGFLQKKFNQPNVHLYPWDLDTQPNKKIRVSISRFIAQSGKVYLDATWEIEDMKTEHKIAKLFNTSIQTNMTTTDIVDAMNKVFGILEEDIAKGLHQIQEFKTIPL